MTPEMNYRVGPVVVIGNDDYTWFWTSATHPPCARKNATYPGDPGFPTC